MTLSHFFHEQLFPLAFDPDGLLLVRYDATHFPLETVDTLLMLHLFSEELRDFDLVWVFRLQILVILIPLLFFEFVE